MTCERCHKEFQSFKIQFNGHEVDSTVCGKCLAAAKAELDKYPKAPQSKKKQ
jgi:hypothetical protein